MENTIVKLLTTCKSYNYNRIKKGKIMIDKQELHKIFSEMRKGNNSQFACFSASFINFSSIFLNSL